MKGIKERESAIKPLNGDVVSPSIQGKSLEIFTRYANAKIAVIKRKTKSSKKNKKATSKA